MAQSPRGLCHSPKKRQVGFAITPYAAAASRHQQGTPPLPLLHRSSSAPAATVPRYPEAASARTWAAGKVARIGNFATHKKNVQKRSLVVEKRPKKSRQTYATSKAPARAPKKAVRDAPKKK